MNEAFYQGLLFFVAVFIFSIGSFMVILRKKSNSYLGYFFAIMGFALFQRFLESSDLILHVPHLIEVDFPLCFCAIPLYYFFQRTYLGHQQPTRKEIILHGILPFISFIILLPVFLKNTPEKIDYILNDTTDSFGVRYFILNTLFFIQSVSYLIVTVVQVRKNTTAPTAKKQFVFILSMVLLSIQFIALLFAFLVEESKKFQYHPIISITILLFIVLWIIQKADILKLKGDITAESESQKYQNSTLTENELTKIAQSIELLMIDQQLFLKKQLSISDIGKELDLLPKTVSEVINRTFDKTFSEYINLYRVDYSKKLLRENVGVLTIEGIGLESGFSSRATFYSNFKKVTGMTPQEYISEPISVV